MKNVSLWHASAEPSGTLRVDTTSPRLSAKEAQQVARYLRGGRRFALSQIVLVDPLAADDEPRIPVTRHTDGEWIWDESLLYYVQNYQLAPPEEFLTYLRARNYEPRMPSTSEIVRMLNEGH